MTAGNPQLGREARHVALSQVGAEGQARIAASNVLLIGAGGIGCAAACYLASAGIGQLRICDFDTVDVSNLGRQFLYGPDDIGSSKATRATAILALQNPGIDVAPLPERLDDAAMAKAVLAADLVLDGCDNFATRFQVNEACVRSGRRLITGSAIRLEGQMAVFGPDYSASPCYRCLYREADESLESCAGNGVLAAVPGVIGTLMAVEALKIASGLDVSIGRLTLYDAAPGDFRFVAIDKRADCPICA